MATLKAVGRGLAIPLFAIASLQGQPPAASLKPVTFSEGYRQVVPSAGGIVVGVVSDSNVHFAGQFRIRVPATPEAQKRVCVEINSIDGRYWAKAEFDVSGGPGLKELILPTAYRSILDKFGPTQVAISAVLADRCEPASNLYLVASWGVTDPSDEAVILVNAQPGTSVNLSDRSSQVETACDKVDATDGVAFSTSCKVRIPGSTAKAYFLRRRHFETRLKDLPFTIVK